MKIPFIKIIKTLVTIAAGVIGALALACETPSQAGDASIIGPSPTSAPSDRPSPTPRPYDPENVMFRIFPSFDGATQLRLDAALEEVLAQNDTSMVPVLIEAFRLFPSEQMAESAAAALTQLTGQSFDAGDWNGWMEWYGKNRERYEPPEGYLRWKTNFMSEIHPRFGTFLRAAEGTARIDMTEVVWGGVFPDGIPDLINPPAIPVAAADYLGDGERVFGVSINGEHRAYPLRIVNAHEMANDTLGGEPIALAY